MNLDLKSVELFIRVAALGAIGRAGEAFGYSPATASQRIRSLEKELGVTLFIRTTRSVTLTQDGDLFLAHAKSILSSIEDARQDLSGGATRVKGLLRVTASASFGQLHISPYIAEFMEMYPQAQVQLHFTDTILDIVELGYDLSIRIGTLSASTLVARKLANNPRSLVASPNYIKKHGAPTTVRDLADHNCLVQGSTRLWGFRDKKNKKYSISADGNFESNHGETIRDAVVSGVGIGLRSNWSMLDELKQGKLVKLLPEYDIDPVWQIWAVRPAAVVMPARVRVFLKFLEKKFESLPRDQGEGLMS